MAMDLVTLGLGLDARPLEAGAKRAEGALTSLSATEKTTVAQSRQSYADRLAAITTSYRSEIEAAQQAQRARLRATISSAEVEQVRNAYRQQVEAAQAAARAQVAAAQQAHLAATQGMRPMIDATEVLSTTARRSGASLNTVRSAMQGLVASSLATAPGVAQVTGALGTMALGTVTMIAVLAGIAAVGFAWKKLSADARENKEATRAAIDELERLRVEQNQGALGTTNASLATARTEQDVIRIFDLPKMQKEFAAASAWLSRATNEGERQSARERQAAAAARLAEKTAEYNKLGAQIRAGEAKLAEIVASEQEKLARDAKRLADERAAANEKGAAESARAEQEYIEQLLSARKLIRETAAATYDYSNVSAGLVTLYADITSELNKANLATDTRNKLLREQVKVIDELVSRGVVGGNGDIRGGLRDTSTGPETFTPPPRAPSQGGGGLFDPLRNRFFGSVGSDGERSGGMLDPKAILNNAVGGVLTSGINMAIGAVGKFADSLFDFSGKAKRAAEEAQKAHDAFSRSMNDAIDALSGSLSSEFRGARSTVVSQFTDINERLGVRGAMGEMAGINALAGQQDFGSLIKTLEAIRAGSKAAGDSGYEYAELTKLIEYATAAQKAYNEALVESRAMAREANEVLRLRSQGLDAEADALALANTRARELAGIKDEELRAIIAQGHALQDVISARQKEIEQAQRLSDFTGTVLGLEAENARGGPGYADALRASMEFDAAKQIAEAQKLLAAGDITQELFDRLSTALGTRLTNAIDDVTRAVEDAAKAAEEARRSFETSLQFAEFEQAGNQIGAATLRAMEQARAWREEADKLGLGADIFGRIQAWLDAEIARINAGPAVEAAAVGRQFGSQTETTRSYTTVSEMTALRQTDLQRGTNTLIAESNRWLAQIAGRDNGTRTSGRGVTVTFNNYGPITADNANAVGRKIGRAISRQISEDIAYDVEAENKQSGNAAN